jgi:hypothetical protein
MDMSHCKILEYFDTLPVLGARGAAQSAPVQVAHAPIVPDSDHRMGSEQLVSECLRLIVVGDTTTVSGYTFYIEVIHLLIVLFSGQLKQKETLFIKLALEVDYDFSRQLVARLLSNFLKQQPIPSSSWTSYFFKEKNSILADKSIILLLLLINQNPKEFVNNYRLSLNSLVDLGITKDNVVNISFKILQTRIQEFVGKDEITLLFYTLLLKNDGFKEYVIQDSNYADLIVEILHVVYNSIGEHVRYSQMYTLLSLLLVLSQESMFIARIHEIVFKYVLILGNHCTKLVLGEDSVL